MIALFFLFNVFAEPPTPVQFDDFDPLNYEEVISRPWRAPSYAEQEKKLGYSLGAFAIPAGFENRVSFWIDIYSKYSSSQGVLHDEDYTDIVHEVIDFSSIEGDESLSSGARAKKRRKLVDAAKKRAKERLLRLHGVKSEKDLTPLEAALWKKYQKVPGKNKFKKAASKGRLRFQLGQSDRFQQAIYYSGRYIEEMEKIFDEMNLPRELVRLVYVESSFNVFAVSRVGASGLYQIMPRTGRQFLKVGKSVDLRNHPMEATKAAAKLLKQYYNMLESWPLAVSGYNHGAYGIRRLTKKLGTRDIVKLTSHPSGSRRFGFASRNFYAAFVAAVEVEKNAKKYFENVVWSPLLEQEQIRTTSMIGWDKLVEWFDGDAEKARLFNPHITYRARRGYRLIPTKTTLHLPKGKAVAANAHMSKVLRTPTAKFKRYKIKKGDTLGRIASRHGTSVKKLKSINELASAHKIQIGQWIRVPQR